MSTPKISLRDVRQVFQVRDSARRGATRDFVAVDDFSLDVPAGEFVTLVGPSGCGKSTILDLVAGLTRPARGTVAIDGEEVREPGLDRSIVFQQYALLPWRNALGNVEFALEAKGVRSRTERRERARHFLDLVGLDGFADRHPHELSGGMKQRVAIARSLSCEPEILLMDEPFGALDAQTRESMQEELLQIWERTRTTALFVTHGIDEAVYLGQRVVVMSSRPGRVRAVLDVPLRQESPDDDVRSSPEFAAYRHQIWQLLREESDSPSAPGVAVGHARAGAPSDADRECDEEVTRVA